MQIAWENMETARVIAEKRRNEVSKDSEAYKEAAKLAARIYMSIGEILSMQEREEREEEALQEFTKALALRLEVEKADSRELAETYFTLGSTILRGRGKREEGRGKREEGRGKREEGRGKREEGRGKREEGRGKREEGRGKREEGRGKREEGRSAARSRTSRPRRGFLRTTFTGFLRSLPPRRRSARWSLTLPW